jgi:sulfite exporter TauE/SafE/copper chaperone CopZ
MPVVTETLRVQGMRCTSCEDIVERTLRHLRGVREAKANYGSESVVVTYDSIRCNLFQISKALELKGYECKLAPKPRPFRDGLRKLFRILIGFAGILALFYVGNHLPQTESVLNINQQASISLLFLVGLLTSFHCVGMCGGFIAGYTAHCALGESKRSHGFAHITYGLGKTLSYATIGAAFGYAGSLFSITPTMKGTAAIAAGVFLLGFGLNMLHWLPHLRFFHLPMPRRLSRFVHAESRKRQSPFVIGLLNGLMIACGPLQAMYVMAAGTGSAWEGAKILLVFGTGTLPLLLGFGFLTSLISHQASGKIIRASGLIVLTLGLIMVNRGLILTGSGYDFTSLTERAEQKTSIVPDHQPILAEQVGGQQILRTEVNKEGFEPSTFLLRRGVPVRWIIKVKELTECNSSIVIPSLNLQISLHSGEQTVEFTPTTTGTILWSCWMGMLRGEFQVEDEAPVILDTDFIGPLPLR